MNQQNSSGINKREAGDLLQGLNPQQIEAVKHENGPLLILAGAGSGKTRVITHRIAWLIARCNVRPGAILAITFTNKAAAEMKTRVEKLVGPDSFSMWIGTFHAMMMRILRRYADRLGFSANLTILDSDDQQKLVKSCLKDLNFNDQQLQPRAVHSQISAAKNALEDVEQFTRRAGSDYRLGRIAKVYALYQDRLKKSNSMDFDDILFYAVRLLQENQDVLAEYQERFRYILVDEYQDTNHAQYQLVRMLSARHHNLCVVGDDDQSIYSFRGANIQNILDFEKDFKGCKVIKLEQNYRSTTMILNAANQVIRENRGRKAKALWTRRGQGDKITFLRAEGHSEESRFIAGEIERLVNGGRNYEDFAILYRLNALSRNLEAALREQGIPYRIFSGTRFYDRREIKDVLAYLRLISSPNDDLALARVINVPRRGIGEITISSIELLANREGVSWFTICAQAEKYPELQRAAAKLKEFADRIRSFQNLLVQNDMTFMAFVDLVERESGLVQSLLDRQEKILADESVDRLENLRELLSDAQEFEQNMQSLQRDLAGADLELEPEDELLRQADDLTGVLAAFLERAALYAEMDEDKDNQNYVRLMTIHSAKGLEFDYVFLVGAEEGLFPGYRARDFEADMEEERRLAYVAITRAREKLYVTSARSRLVFGQTMNLPVSRFFQNLDDDFFEEIGGPRRSSASFAEPQGQSNPFDLYSQQPALNKRTAPAGSLQKEIYNSRKSNNTGKPSDQEVDIDQFRSGRQVNHPKFGSGTITSVLPVAGDAIVEIEFGDNGKKRMLARTSGVSFT